MKTKIKSITLNLNGQDVVVSIEEAEKLYAELDKLFAEPKTTVINTPVVWRERVIPSPAYEQPWRFTCGGTTSGITMLGS